MTDRDEPYWEISGPRQYLHIPTSVPDRWRAAVTVGSLGNYRTVVGWGPTQDAAQAAARKLVADGENAKVTGETK